MLYYCNKLGLLVWNVTKNLEPFPISDSMWKLALWRFKICLTIDKPRPVLPEFLEREGSTLKNLFVKRGIFWVATPMPKSSTVRFTTSLVILILTSIGFFDWLCVMAFSIILKKNRFRIKYLVNDYKENVRCILSTLEN